MNPETDFDVVGKEQETVMLFVDLRNFTKLSETTLPYDVIYILNNYDATCGKAIEANSGRLDKFIGDRIMAISEVSDSIEVNCKRAVKAASEISSHHSAPKTVGEVAQAFLSDTRYFVCSTQKCLPQAQIIQHSGL